MGTKVLAAFGVMSLALVTHAEQWCGLTVAPEDRCSPYERHEDYSYNASIEVRHR